jgi:hypothetical protein
MVKHEHGTDPRLQGTSAQACQTSRRHFVIQLIPLEDTEESILLRVFFHRR